MARPNNIATHLRVTAAQLVKRSVNRRCSPEAGAPRAAFAVARIGFPILSQSLLISRLSCPHEALTFAVLVRSSFFNRLIRMRRGVAGFRVNPPASRNLNFLFRKQCPATGYACSRPFNRHRCMALRFPLSNLHLHIRCDVSQPVVPRLHLPPHCPSHSPAALRLSSCRSTLPAECGHQNSDHRLRQHGRHHQAKNDAHRPRRFVGRGCGHPGVEPERRRKRDHAGIAGNVAVTLILCGVNVSVAARAKD